MLNKIRNFSWQFCGVRYKPNWPYILIVVPAFAAVAIYQYCYY